MEEEFDDTDANLIYERMRDKWKNVKAEMELQKAKTKYSYRSKCFINWFLDIQTISFIDLEPTEIL